MNHYRFDLIVNSFYMKPMLEQHCQLFPFEHEIRGENHAGIEERSSSPDAISLLYNL